VIGSGLGVDFGFIGELFLSVVALLDMVCFFFFPLSIYIAEKAIARVKTSDRQFLIKSLVWLEYKP
jgi:hypothetical protein